MNGRVAKRLRREARAAVENGRAAVAGSAPLMTSAEALRMVRQNKHNPLPHLKPEMLARVLDAFEHGYLREPVLLWEKIAERDDVIVSVKPKREKDVSQLDMQVTAEPDSGDEGEAHRAVLEKFWKSVRAVNAYDRNEKGRFRRLVKQMMTAVSYRYAAHHIIWDPRPDGELRATFEFVPLWMFENRTGTLRYLPSTSATQGEPLADGEWMVTVGDGLMIAACIGYLAKRSSFNDWLIFSEKFSVPGVLGRTTAKQGSPEGEAMRDAVESFGHDWVGVIYEDDGTHGDPIKLVQAQGSPAGMPMPAVIERIDRKFAAMWRGADLSSMSSGPAGDGTGASLQEKETDILKRDDAETIAETLADVSRMVIEWYFGHGVEPLAKVELIVPGDEDQGKDAEVDAKLAELGVTQDPAELAERYGRKHVAAKAQPLETEELENAETFREWAENARAAQNLHRLRGALAADLQPLGDALFAAYQAGDDAALRAALKKVSERMPELAGAAENLSAALAARMADAFTGGSEELENAARKNPQRKHAKGTAAGRGGKFAASNWQGYGLVPAAAIPADPAHPPVKPQDAEARLMKGEAVLSDGGEVVGFTRSILDHWKNDAPVKPPQEIRRRLTELDDAVGAVAQPHEVWEISTRSGLQRTYLRKYAGQRGDRWMAVFVPVGTGRTYFSSYQQNQADDSFRKGNLIRTR